jgi:hypothetical protein
MILRRRAHRLLRRSNPKAQCWVLHRFAFESSTVARQFIIQGLTQDGRVFRPSDWAERLAGAMSSFRPSGLRGGIGAAIGYSPYCVPSAVGDVKCVIVNEALRDLEPMAWDFVMNFARDNSLQMGEVCVIPDLPVKMAS